MKTDDQRPTTDNARNLDGLRSAVGGLSQNSLEAGISANREAISGQVGYQRGPVSVAANGGVTWRKDWFVGAKAIYKF